MASDTGQNQAQIEFVCEEQFNEAIRAFLDGRQDLDQFVKQQHSDNTSTAEDLPAAELINNNVSTSEDLPAAQFINNNASTSEDPASTARIPVLLVASEGEAVDREEKAFRVVCGMEFTGAHSYDICKNPVHAIYGNTAGEEGYGSRILCYLCQKRREYK
ncbi:hypothetical protein ILUMI_01350 [Ignelater luminosus]|uniref:SCAN domain-containing protein n=1 Tax=Ignelater luminosus TaxID=2038154 RepID=A0A8K0DET9_IGNLU|nr:hypothetical protein ILUMI_01350 [Ignelater luminosus]